LMPAFMGLGHLAPAIGAIQTATGSYKFPGKLLWLIGTISAVVDCTWTTEWFYYARAFLEIVY
jgi:hypothetical protein